MAVRVDVAPELLRWAVERAGWDAETTQRRAPQFDEWMSGARRPTVKQLEKFAQATHIPFGQLFLPEPPPEPLPIPDMRTPGDATIRRPSADLLDTIYICQDRQDWYRAFAQDGGAEPINYVGTASTTDAPEPTAARIRNALTFGLEQRSAFTSWTDALRRLIDRVEDTGALVMVSGIVGSNTHRILDPQEFRGFALSDPVAPLIFVNGADTKAAQIFTLIHEFAHLWLGRSALSDAAMRQRDAQEDERWCNQVAAEVLIPLDSLRETYHDEVHPEALDNLARIYRVSTLVVLKRIFDAGYLAWDEFRSRYDDEVARVVAILERRSGDAGGGNYYHTQPLRLSRQFASAVISSAYEGATGYREAYQLLGTKKHGTFERLADQLGVG